MVISQYIGRKDSESAGKSASQLLMFGTIFSLLVAVLVLIHNLFNAAAFPFSGAMSSGLRAAGDVKFTMAVSVLSTVGVRLLLSYLLGIVFHMGVIGIALAMVCDWIIRAVIFIWRQRSGKWKEFQVIS